LLVRCHCGVKRCRVRKTDPVSCTLIDMRLKRFGRLDRRF
jgi:hypothetical protein